MTRAREIAYRLRGLLLAAGTLFSLLGITWVVLPCFNDTALNTWLFGEQSDFVPFGLFGTPFTPGRLVNHNLPEYLANVSFVLGIVLLAQWAFLRPSRGWAVQMTSSVRPLKTAVLSAALMATLLSVGLISLLLELADWWAPILGGTEKEPLAGGWGIVGVWTAMLLAWVLWGWLFFVYWKQGDRYTQMGKMVRGLVVGSLLEMFIAVPVHLWATRQRECYCCRGTYTTLVLAGTVLLWAFGPGILLLYWREKYRREKLLSPSKSGIDVLSEVRK